MTTDRLFVTRENLKARCILVLPLRQEAKGMAMLRINMLPQLIAHEFQYGLAA